MCIKAHIVRYESGIYRFRISQYVICVLLFVSEESLDIAHHAANSLVDFSVDGIIDDLVGFCPGHLINHLPTGEMLSYHVYALVDKTINGSVNYSIYGEV